MSLNYYSININLSNNNESNFQFGPLSFFELSNFAAAIGAGAKFLSEQNAGFPFSIKKGGYYN